MEENKLYTILVYSENIAGVLNQITAVFTRRQVNIESLNVCVCPLLVYINTPLLAIAMRRWQRFSPDRLRSVLMC